MLTRRDELPPTTHGGRNHEPYVAKDVRAFLRHPDWDVAELSYEGRKACQIAQAVRKYLKDHAEQCEGVAVTVRGGTCFLYRKIGGE